MTNRSEPEGPTWETANGFTAKGAPLWQRQLSGGAVAVVAAFTVGWPDISFADLSGAMSDAALRDLIACAVAWLVIAFVVRFHVFVGWRVVDELDIDFKTRALRLAQRRLGGRRQRTVQVYDLESVREVSYGSYRGNPLDWFVFKLKSGDKIRFRCPPGILSMTRRALKRAELPNTESWKGAAVQPAAADGDGLSRS
jgi:hypothetical protein